MYRKIKLIIKKALETPVGLLAKKTLEELCFHLLLKYLLG
jgi:hypothetical protein